MQLNMGLTNEYTDSIYEVFSGTTKGMYIVILKFTLNVIFSKCVTFKFKRWKTISHYHLTTDWHLFWSLKLIKIHAEWNFATVSALVKYGRKTDGLASN